MNYPEFPESCDNYTLIANMGRSCPEIPDNWDIF